MGAGLLGALQLFSIMQTVVVVAEVMVEVVVVYVLVVVKTSDIYVTLTSNLS